MVRHVQSIITLERHEEFFSNRRVSNFHQLRGCIYKNFMFGQSKPELSSDMWTNTHFYWTKTHNSVTTKVKMVQIETYRVIVLIKIY
jgi:hypothetical protein